MDDAKQATQLFEAGDDWRDVLPLGEAKELVAGIIGRLDRGEIRVAEIVDDEVVVNESAKHAILMWFRVNEMAEIEAGPFEYVDKLPLKHGYEEAGVRVVPGASARFGAYLARGVVMMPSYVNIGAHVDTGTMVDTWATVGSCAQIGKNVHLSGGVGIGGVLEPPQAVPVVVGDDCFIGSRCMIVDGARVKDGAKLGAGLVVTSTTHVIEAETGHELPRGVIPERAVVISGNAPERVRGGHVRTPVRADPALSARRHGPRQVAAERDPARARHRFVTQDLLALTETLCEIPSVSGTEAALADVVEARLHNSGGALKIERIGANVVARTDLGRPQRIVLGGHLDTVPANGNATPRREGDVLHGLGTADMKGGLAILLALADNLAQGNARFDVTPRAVRRRGGRRRAQRIAPAVRGSTRARAMRSRDHARAHRRLGRSRLSGDHHHPRRLRRRARRTRPDPGWARTQSTAAAALLDFCANFEAATVDVDSLEYREALQIVRIEGGVANNVVPDRCSVVVNRRYAPVTLPRRGRAGGRDVLHRGRRRPHRSARTRHRRHRPT